jgi:hypothetical protein
MKYGKITVIKRMEKAKNGHIQWLCKCDCGNEKLIVGSSLTSGRTRSCGCMSCIVVHNRKQNTYDLSGEYGIGYTISGEEFYFDLNDYEKIKDYCWYLSSDGYVKTNKYVDELSRQIKLFMHRLIFDDLKNNEMVDHIYHKKNDNRKSQLRIVSNQQNNFNHGLSKNNTSNHTGVYWHKKHNKWEALICYDKRIIYLGLYDLYEEAVNAREDAEIKYFKQYKYQMNTNVC